MSYNTTYLLTWHTLAGFQPMRNCSHTVPDSAKFCPRCGKPVGFTDLDERIADFIRAAREHDDIFYGVSPDGGSYERCSWYQHEADMVLLSKEFPGVLFVLEGEGEEGGDLWRKYFFNGKIQRAKAEISYPAFDPDKLHEEYE